MKKTLLVLTLSSLFLTACAKPENKDAPIPSSKAEHNTATQTSTEASATVVSNPVGDTAETALDWAGEYTGVFPCADCEGIETELELKSDKTYELTEKYLGKGDGKEFKVKGTFSFDTENPSVITLDQASEKRKFFIGENFAEARDTETGKALDTKLNYKLNKEMH